jgi:hypothetical protein
VCGDSWTAFRDQVGTIKARMRATLLMKTLRRVAAEMALHVLAYNLVLPRQQRTGDCSSPT